MGDIIQFEPDHFLAICPRERLDTDGVEGWSVNGSLEHALTLAKSGPAFSYRSTQGEILAVSGATLFWPGVGWGWAFIDKRAFVDAAGLVHAFKRGIAGLMSEGGFHRLQATVRADYDRGQRFAHLVGLTDDIVTLKNFGQDRIDHILFAKLAR
ncbi:MAG: hypothetical protein RDU24_08795 [Humidesulfovibrio sp.]|uniref:hypothetical protein n=1 Tax=Humidesulfovibrio sp. TaxID=2910988 RepID=UPI0027F079F7|nr:hypothetical protein [Humidesulfovibrio sp.]MDQ7835465.1 hypothetical protein [Humidesulfovibrio sp.]